MMNKKIIAGLLSLTMVASIFSSCGKQPVDNTSSTVSEVKEYVLTDYPADDNFETIEAWDKNEQSTVTKVENGMKITPNGKVEFAYAGKTVVQNIDDFPMIEIDIAEISDLTAYHILASNDGATDQFLTAFPMIQTGKIYVDIRYSTGWKGEQEFTFKIALTAPIGLDAKDHKYNEIPDGAFITVKSVRTLSLPEFEEQLLDTTTTDDDFQDLTKWNVRYGNEIESIDGGLKYTKLADNVNSYIFKSVEYDLEEYPSMEIKVNKISEGSYIHITTQEIKGNSDFFITEEGPILEPGTYSLDIAGQTGWLRKMPFLFKIWVINEEGLAGEAEIEYIKLTTN